MATQVTISPAAGKNLVPTQGGPGATPGFDALDYRRAWTRSLNEGVTAAAAFKVTERLAGPTMQVEVDADIAGAYVQGDAITNQGLYYVPPHSTNVLLDVAAANGTNPRVDSIVLEIKDNAHDGLGQNLSQLRVVTGTATAGATLTNRTGAPNVPAIGSALWLADVLVPAGATSVTSANMRDYRRWALADARVSAVQEFAGPIPAGWRAMDGTAVSRLVYAALFAEIGTTFGSGDGTYTFNLPEGRGRVLLGAGQGSGLSARVLAAIGGLERVGLTTGEMPAHNHGGVTGSMNRNNPHSHVIHYMSGNPAVANWHLIDGDGTRQFDGFDLGTQPTDINHEHSIASDGGGQTHENMPPFLVLNRAIFTAVVA